MKSMMDVVDFLALHTSFLKFVLQEGSQRGDSDSSLYVRHLEIIREQTRAVGLLKR